jgi:hypothetical protein
MNIKKKESGFAWHFLKNSYIYKYILTRIFALSHSRGFRVV